MGDDPTTNYQLLPGDRLVIPFKPGAGSDDEDSAEVRPSAEPPRNGPKRSRRTSRRDPEVRAEPDEDRAVRRAEATEDRSALRDLERRLGAVERKLDRILEALERREP